MTDEERVKATAEYVRRSALRAAMAAGNAQTNGAQELAQVWDKPGPETYQDIVTNGMERQELNDVRHSGMLTDMADAETNGL